MLNWTGKHCFNGGQSAQDSCFFNFLGKPSPDDADRFVFVVARRPREEEVGNLTEDLVVVVENNHQPWKEPMYIIK